MKKALLLSVIASTMIMAGGDIAPVEPVVEVEAPAPSGWTFTGQGVVYYQTADELGAGVDARSLLDDESSSANAGVSLKAENKDIIGGLGAGVKLVGVGTLDLQGDIGVVSNVMETADGTLNGGAITELYLTYGIGNTLVKVGRQELPKALSPLAFSESWNVFANTFEAAVVINSDIPNTTLVGAWVRSANTHTDLGQFDDILGSDDGVYMLTAAYAADTFNVTGTGYYAPELVGNEDLYALWVDAGFNVSDFNIGVQAGYINSDGFFPGHEDTYALGAKFGAKFDPVTVGAAVTWVNDGYLGVFNVGNLIGGGSVSGLFGENALYTCSPLGSNVYFNFMDATTVSANASVALPVGTLTVLADYSDVGDYTFAGEGDFYEGAIAYNVVLGDLDLTAGYVYQNIDVGLADTDNNLIRVVARYNF